jgi:hypothetical protein
VNSFAAIIPEGAGETVLLLFKIILVAGGVLIGAVLGNWLVRGLWYVRAKDLSRAGTIRSRLVGGVAGGVLAYLLLWPLGLGDGLGFGPGKDGRGANGVAAHTTSPAAPSAPPTAAATPAATLATTKPPAKPPTVVRIKLLGVSTSPAVAADEQLRIFVLLDQDAMKPVSVDEIIEHVKAAKRALPADAPLLVKLLTTPNSTYLLHSQVERLRSQVKALDVNFDMPDPKNPKHSPEAGT